MIKIKKIICVILTISLVVLVFAFGVQGVSSVIASNDRVDAQSYINASYWTDSVDSYLYEQDGSYIAVAPVTVNGTDKVAIETYSSSYSLQSVQYVAFELTLWGGVYIGEDYNYIVFGQENYSESNSVEVIRVVKYTKDWTRVSSASLYGANTYEPFIGGRVSCAEYDGTLYIHTSHKMYAISGTNHQASMLIAVDTSSMEVTGGMWTIENNSYGYVSHTFNQFVLIDDGQVITLDQGDQYPRALIICRFDDGWPSGEWTTTCDYALAYEISGTGGNNNTGVSVGGFEASSSYYIIAGTSVDYTTSDTLRNVFVNITSKEDFESGSTIWITGYTTDKDVSNVRLVKISTDTFCLLWTEGEDCDTLRYVYINGSGSLLTSIYSASGQLSDCQPIVSDDDIIWYVSDGSAVTFYSVSANYKTADGSVTVETTTAETTTAETTTAETTTAETTTAETTTAETTTVTQSDDETTTENNTEVYDSSVDDYMLGDVIINSKIELSDAREILRMVLELDEGTELQEILADVDGSGELTLRDARAVLCYALGLQTSFDGQTVFDARIAEYLGTGDTTEESTTATEESTTAAEESTTATEEDTTTAEETTTDAEDTTAAEETTTDAEDTTESTETTTDAEDTTAAEETTTSEEVINDIDETTTQSEEDTTVGKTFIYDADAYESLPEAIQQYLLGTFTMTGVLQDGNEAYQSTFSMSSGEDFYLSMTVSAKEQNAIMLLDGTGYWLNVVSQAYYTAPSTLIWSYNWVESITLNSYYDKLSAVLNTDISEYTLTSVSVSGVVCDGYVFTVSDGSVMFCMNEDELVAIVYYDSDGNRDLMFTVSEFTDEADESLFDLSGWSKYYEMIMFFWTFV